MKGEVFHVIALHCLVYTSVANKKFSDSHLQALLKKCRHNNEKVSISGILLYLDPFFIQILEGDEAIVKSLFDTIKKGCKTSENKDYLSKTN